MEKELTEKEAEDFLNMEDDNFKKINSIIGKLSNSSDRFMLANNPISGDKTTCILHVVTPVTIFEVMDGLIVVIYSETDDMEKINKIRERARHWYQACLNKDKV